MSESKRTTESDRLLLSLMAPPELSDDEIRRLPESGVVGDLSGEAEDRIQRVLRQTQQMIAEDPGLPEHRLVAESEVPRHPHDSARDADMQKLIARRTTQKSNADPHPDVHPMPPRTDRIAPRVTQKGPSAQRGNSTGAAAALVIAALSLTGVILLTARDSLRRTQSTAQAKQHQREQLRRLQETWLTAAPQPFGHTDFASTGDTLRTGPQEKRRVTLPDHSVLYLNTDTQVRIRSDRQVDVPEGSIYVEVAEAADSTGRRIPFVIHTPQRTVTALGTRFAVDTDDRQTEVTVTQGQVSVAGLARTLTAGDSLRVTSGANGKPLFENRPPQRISESIAWTRDLVSAAEDALVPDSPHAGGSLIAVDSTGQDMQLSLRKVHIDVHIEDGFARTTIDQTYFNHTNSRLEGTFRFPLPADASLSRLAMYVNGRLMEGGMAEREHARNTFEQIVHKMKDPALLEWVDGSTFRMRVFPLEARQEKRIILSYTQRLSPAYDRLNYRFPAGHSLQVIRDWSASVRIRNGADSDWGCASHNLSATVDGSDLVLTAEEHKVTADRDLVLQVAQEFSDETPRLLSAVYDNHRYLMLQWAPDLSKISKESGVPPADSGTPLHHVVLFESSADRNPVLARTQIEILRTLLTSAEHHDQFSIITAGASAAPLTDRPMSCKAADIRRTLRKLDRVHLVGALNLEDGLKRCAEICDASRERVRVIHLGSGIPVLGEQQQESLAAILPETAEYVGIGVGKKQNQPLMKQLAGRSGGCFTQIDPDEEVRWRALELHSLLQAPRLTDIAVRPALPRGTDSSDGIRFLPFAETTAHGESLAAVARIPAGKRLPRSIEVSGLLNGRPWSERLPVRRVDRRADFLPRTWARLEIDRMVEEGAAENKSAIVELSKAMYVMSPFTSLLVLENEEMYTQYNIDRGRKDHWALYDCPQEIKVVHEPLQYRYQFGMPNSGTSADALKFCPKPAFVSWPDQTIYLSYDQNGAWSSPRNYYRGWAGSLSTFSVQPQAVDNFSSMSGSPTRWGLNQPVDAWMFKYGMVPSFRQGSPPLTRTQGLNFSTERFDFIMPNAATIQVPTQFGRTSGLMMQSGQYFDFDSAMDGAPALNFFSDGYSEGFALIQQPPAAVTYINSMDHLYYLPETRSDQLLSETGRLGAVRLQVMPPDDAARQLTDLLRIVPEMPAVRPVITTNRFEAGLIDIGRLPQPEALSAGYGHSWEFDAPAVPPQPVQLPQFGPTEFPEYGVDRAYWADLLSLAPGLNTSRWDRRMATAEERSARAEPGTVDENAARLLNKARSAGWQRVTLPGTDTAEEILVHSAGMFTISSRQPKNLRELIVCDGLTLRHVYPQLGLAAERQCTPVIRQALTTRFPWLVPSPEDLSRGADILSEDQSTVLIVPHHQPSRSPESEDQRIGERLHFSSEGTLQSRQWFRVRDGSVLATMYFDTDNEIRLTDDEGEEVGRVSVRREPTVAPETDGITDGIVILPLPLMTTGSLPEELQQTTDFASLTEKDALQVVASALADNNGQRLCDCIRTRFIEQADRRDGFYVLLARYPSLLIRDITVDDSDGRSVTVNLLPDPAQSELCRYLALNIDWLRTGNDSADLSEAEWNSDFLRQLIRERNIFWFWKSGRATENRSHDEIRAHLKTLREFLPSCTTDEVRWGVLSAAEKVVPHYALGHEFSQAAMTMADSPKFGYLARREAARTRFRPGHAGEARRIYARLLLDTADNGRMPRVDPEIHSLFIADGGQSHWDRLAVKVLRRLLKADRPSAAAQWQVQIRHFEGDSPNTANVLLDILVDSIRSGVISDPHAVLLCVEQMRQTGDDRAAELLRIPVENGKVDLTPELLLYAASVAESLGDPRMSLQYTEKAVQMKFENRPEQINLAPFRSDYTTLLQRFRALIDEDSPKGDRREELIVRIIGAADQWRSVEPDSQECARLTAGLLNQLGAEDAAWSYLTSPLAGRSGESAPWRSLAEELSSSDQPALADIAWSHAFRFEQTNPEILLKHAEHLDRLGQHARRDQLLHRIADAEWQPRYSQTVRTAKERLAAAER